jgi:hypothetical protein
MKREQAEYPRLHSNTASPTLGDLDRQTTPLGNVTTQLAKSQRCLKCKSTIRKEGLHRQALFVEGIKLPLKLPPDAVEPLLAIRIGALFNDPPAPRSSPAIAMVVLRAAPLTIAAGRGLRTFALQSTSRSPLTIRRAAPAERSVFSFCGLPVVAEGLRRRWARFIGTEPCAPDERLFIADPILRASD